MPMMIEHIDAIARRLQRDVLYIAFNRPQEVDCENVSTSADWGTLPRRQQVIDWLDARGIGWRCCGHYADVNCMLSYQGQIYVDVPFEQNHPVFQELTAFLENLDGSMRFADCTLYYCPLDHAIKNAAHDEPEFWERWAETF
jgi:hypothetical protein